MPLDKSRSLGIAVTGTGRNIQEAKTPAIAERKGIRVGLIGYNASWTEGRLGNLPIRQAFLTCRS
ncbi:MAG: CapA family protein [Clostridium sp.]